MQIHIDTLPKKTSRRRKMKKVTGAILVGFLVFCSVCIVFAGAKKEAIYAGAPQGIIDAVKNGLKIEVIRNLGADEHTALFLAGCKSEGKSLGIDVDTFVTNGDDAKFEDVFSQILLGNYD
jgi:simple sugar transport system substrate-binding protein